MSIVVFGADNCAGCKTVKDVLKSKGIEFVERDVNNINHMEEAQHYGVRSIPTVVVDGGGVEQFFIGASKAQIDSMLLYIEGDKV